HRPDAEDHLPRTARTGSQGERELAAVALDLVSVVRPEAPGLHALDPAPGAQLQHVLAAALRAQVVAEGIGHHRRLSRRLQLRRPVAVLRETVVLLLRVASEIEVQLVLLD